jgi:dihydroflavonol-4-reductase
MSTHGTFSTAFYSLYLQNKKEPMVFVTGGTGLIGSHLLFRLALVGKQVKALRRPGSNTPQVLKVFSWYCDNPDELFSRIEWVNGDMLDYFEMETLLHGIEEVYHCAGTVSFQAKEHRQMIHNNVEGTANMVNAAIENRIKKFCHVSSVSALGPNLNGYPTDEHTNWVPSKKVSAYSQSKFFSETEVWRGIEEGLNAVIVNPSIVLGPGKWNTGSPRLFKLVWEGLKFYTGGVTGYVDVKDVVRAMTMLMDDSNFEFFKNSRYILNAENKSYLEIFSLIANQFQKPPPKYLAGRLALAVAWRTMMAAGYFINKTPSVTREVAASASSRNYYDGRKITSLKGFDYIPVEESVIQTARIFMAEMKGRKQII